MDQSSMDSNPVTTLFLFAVVGVMLVLVRKGRRQQAGVDLPKGQRLRPLALEWMDPLLVIVLVGVILAGDLINSPSHAWSALIGLLVGAPVGIARAKVMFVRAVPETRSIVMKRSVLEYALLGVVLVVKIAADAFTEDPNSGFMVLLTGLLAFVVGESIARSLAITLRYRADAAAVSHAQ